MGDKEPCRGSYFAVTGRLLGYHVQKTEYRFFKGEGFELCAKIAGMDHFKKIETIYLLGGGGNDKLNRICRHER